MNIVERKKELLEIINKTTNELESIREMEKRQENKKYIGRFFIYYNSYGDDEKMWKVYLHAVSLNEDGNILICKFEKTAEKEYIFMSESLLHYWMCNKIEITEQEYYDAFRNFISEIKP